MSHLTPILHSTAKIKETDFKVSHSKCCELSYFAYLYVPFVFEPVPPQLVQLIRVGWADGHRGEVDVGDEQVTVGRAALLPDVFVDAGMNLL